MKFCRLTMTDHNFHLNVCHNFETCCHSSSKLVVMTNWNKVVGIGRSIMCQTIMSCRKFSMPLNELVLCRSWTKSVIRMQSLLTHIWTWITMLTVKQKMTGLALSPCTTMSLHSFPRALRSKPSTNELLRKTMSMMSV